MSDKLTAIKIKNPDGSYSEQILISVLADNVKCSESLNLKDKLAIIENEIARIIAAPSGSTQLDQEIIAARVGNDGKSYDTLGQAIRANDQKTLNTTLIQLNQFRSYLAGFYDKTETDTAIFAAISDEIAPLTEMVEKLNQSSDTYCQELEVDEDGLVWLLNNGQRIAGPYGPFAGSGGGGGGSSAGGTIMKLSNTTGWLSHTVVKDAECIISMTWSSTFVDDGEQTGDGAVRISVNGALKSSRNVPQGAFEIDVSPYLSTGTNTVQVALSDTDGTSRKINYTITVIELSIKSTFDTTTPFSDRILFPFTPIGAVRKTIHFILDGIQLEPMSTSASNREMTYTIQPQSYGAHSLRCYFESEINGETVRSNELYYEFMSVDPLSEDIIITSSFNTKTVQQYTTIFLTFSVYDPTSLTADVKIYANNVLLSSQTVDRTDQTYTYRADNVGELELKITSGTVEKVFNITVTKSEVDVEAETESLALYLSSKGRSNNEESPGVWGYNNIFSEFTNFNFVSDGWMTDSDGIPVLRVAGDARLTIPYKLFANDFRTTGKTIELEFATSNVLNYDATILSCMSGGRGLSLTAQKATLKSEQSEIYVQYKEDEHIRVTFVIEKRSKNRFLMVYIDGIPSGCVLYPTDDDFSQASPVNISIGSNDCTIDLYNIRIYDNDLTGNQILNNWVADTQIGSLMLERYLRNNVYDDYGKIVIANLPSDLPYFIIDAPELPQYKGDKKTVSGSYVDPMYPEKSFTFTDCQANVQGTSSAVYARKNFDLQFKKGFEMSNGKHEDNYALRPGEIPFNRFVLKADVASSEGANNVELVRLYNDSCLYKTPEMVQNSKVRWGIDGFPVVVFWNNTDTQEMKFWGKYNFNLPKRAPAPYGYDKDETMESWEFQNNTSNLMLFLTDFFDETMYTDPDTGDTKELWRYDYEARFPKDSWTDYSNLQEFQSFVYSTYRTNATGNDLAESVTYEGVTYTKDTADYRLAKFKAEFPSYAELSSFLFYYIFTELFLMVDSRAKNLFIGFNGSQTPEGHVAPRKATAQPYDMDTAIGINNEGTLTFGYGLEDTDHLSSGANIFNGQNSVLWCNVRDAYDTEIRQMYQQLRSEGVLSYSTIEQRFEEHQIKWPEAVWIEDARFKYTDPLTDPDPGKEPTADYLSMLQGSKKQQRKWWLTNRFKYMDSKWNAGDALSQVIILRGYEKANITVTPYADIYPTIKYASYVVQERGAHGQPTTLICPLDTVSDTEISIYSAPQLASVGDLSPLKVGFANFSAATRLQDIKIGDSSSSYENINLYSLTLGNNVLLKSLDVRNCSGLGDTSIVGHTQTVVDISNCSIIENIYFDGTKVQGVTLPNGGNIKVLHLPATITNLTILNQKSITDLTVAGYSNITTLRIENSSVNSRAMLSLIPAGTRVRLVGIAWEAQTAQEIDTLYDLLDTMRGLDENGGNTDKAQVSGTIHIGSLTGAEISAFKERYPYLTINADHTTSTLTYVAADNVTILKEVQCLDGVPQSSAPSGPPKEPTAQYTFTFVGWSRKKNQTVADPDYTQNLSADTTVYPAYTNTIRSYTVTWKNKGTTLKTDTVEYGVTPSYSGSTPTYQGQTATGWEPEISPVTGNITYSATYLPVYTVTYYNDSTLVKTESVVQGANGVPPTETPTKPGSNPGDYEFMGWNPLPNNVQANMSVYAQYKDNRSVVVKYLTNSLDKYETTSNTTLAANAFYNMSSLTEVSGPLTTMDSSAFSSASNLTKVDLTGTSPVTISTTALASHAKLDALFIRSTTMSSMSSTSNLAGTKIAAGAGAIYVPSGLVASYKADSVWKNYFIASIDDYPVTDFSTITDSWGQIFANETNGSYANKYNVGDTKKITINGVEDYMQIVAMEADDLADGSGKAKITWLSKGLFTTHKMNDTATNANGWAQSVMRTWLRETILPTLDSTIQSNIKEVTKTYYDKTTTSTLSITDTVWIPSAREIYGGTLYESEGCDYTSLFNSNAARIKYNTSRSADYWWLRSARSGNDTNFRNVNNNGNVDTSNASSARGVALGFST